MSPEDWDACSWALQRTYVEGFEDEGLITAGTHEREALEEAGITGRAVDTGGGVIDLAAMRAELTGTS
jgi:hypothetical protein